MKNSEMKKYPKYKPSGVEWIGEIPESKQVRIQVKEHVNLFSINNLDDVLATYSRWGEQVRQQVSEQVKAGVNEVKIKNLIKILTFCIKPQKRKDILKKMGLSSVFKNYKSHIVLLINDGVLERTVPESPKSPNQRYRTTEKGKKLLEILK